MTESLTRLLLAFGVVHARNQPIAETVALIELPEVTMIATSCDISEGPELTTAIGIQLARLYFGMTDATWYGQDEAQRARDYSKAKRWAARVLIDEAMCVLAEREEWDARQLAAECGVTLRLAEMRIVLYIADKQGRLLHA